VYLSSILGSPCISRGMGRPSLGLGGSGSRRGSFTGWIEHSLTRRRSYNHPIDGISTSLQVHDRMLLLKFSSRRGVLNRTKR
jgi:hypothetical protein